MMKARLIITLIAMAILMAAPLRTEAKGDMTLAEAVTLPMPVVVITTEGGVNPTCEFASAPDGSMGYTVINASKEKGRVVVIENSDTIYDSGDYVEDESGMTIKINGNTSAYYHDIKPYKIKLEKKGDLLGRGDTYKDKEWRLLNSTSLNTIAGNRLAELIGMAWTPQTAFCNVFLNGTYMGPYTLSECVKRNADCRINVDKDEGYIIERDPYWWAEDVYFATSFFARDNYYRWTFKYPDSEDVDDKAISSIKGFVERAENTIFSPSDGGKSYRSYYDIPSLANWLLVHDIMGTYDSGGANMYFSKYDSKTDTLLKMPVVWDFGTSFECDTAAFSRIHTSSHGYYSTLFSHADGHFAAYYKKKWTTAGDNLIDSLIAFLDEFSVSETASALQTSRTAMGEENETIAAEAARLTNWLSGHRKWLDRNIGSMNVDESLYDDSINNSITDNRELFYDKSTDTYLCTVPKELFDEGRVGEYHNDSINVEFTYLPIVRLEGEFGYDYSNGTVSVVMPDESASQVGLQANIKWRGGSTNASDKHKRNYSLKFVNADGSKKDCKFFGLRNDNHWILDAGQVDMSRIRNRVATDIWNDFAAKPYYYASEPKARTGTRGQFVEVFLNDEYRGIYCMTECIDRSQLKIKKYDEATSTSDAVIHGQLWKGKTFEYTGFRNYGDYDNTSDTWGGFELQYPDIDDVNPTDWSTLYNAVKWAADNDFDDWDGTDDEKQYYDFVTRDIREHIEEYFDIPVLRDYNIFLLLTNAIDCGNGKNSNWFCYDSKVDKKLSFAVWDLDCTVGQNYNPNNRYPDTVQPTATPTRNLLLIFLSYLKSPLPGEPTGKTYNEVVADRYKELRQDIFSLDSLKARYHNYMEMLRSSGAYAREARKWSGDSDIGGETLDFDSEETYIDFWLSKRLAFLDGYFVNDGIENITADSDKKHASGKMYTMSGQRVTSVSKPGIYIINGKKVMIK